MPLAIIQMLGCDTIFLNILLKIEPVEKTNSKNINI